MSEEPVDLVASAGPLDPIVETLRAFLHDSGALRVAAIVETHEAVVDVGRLAPIEVTDPTGIRHLPHAIELEAEPLLRPRVAQLPPFDVDAEQGTVIGTMGGLDMMAQALLELSGAFGGRSVALAQFATSTPDLQLTLTARPGERVLVTIGETEFELPD